MKKDYAVISCICLCLALALGFPRLSASHPMVDESGCRECHQLGDFSLEGLHGVHLIVLRAMMDHRNWGP